MKIRCLLAVCSAVALGGAASSANAQTQKPGLWEINHQINGAAGSQMAEAMAQMKRQMASMPPEQRKMMEDMMAKQGVGMGANGATVKVCLTKEMVERNEVASTAQPGCTTGFSPRSGNTMKFSYLCAEPPSTGQGQVTFVSDTAYTMTMTAQTTQKGKTEKMDLSASAKWLSADCGAVKPLGVPKK